MKAITIISSRIVLSIISIFFLNNLSGQTEFADFTSTGRGVATPFATDYHSLGINPSNLDWDPEFEDKYVTFGLSEFAFSFFSEALGKSDLRDNLYGNDQGDLTEAEEQQLILDFANSAMALDMDIMSVGFAVRTNKLGGFAYSILDRVDYFSQMGPEIAELMVLGYDSDYFTQLILANGDTIANTAGLNTDSLDIVSGLADANNALSLTELLDGSHIAASWIREYKFGWGKKIYSNDDIKLYGGIGVKYMQGMGILQIDIENNIGTGFSSTSPYFDINYGEDIENQNPSALAQSDKLQPVGSGWGFEFGASMVFKEKLTIGVAVTDIGSMKWDGNVYELQDLDVLSMENEGLENLNILDQIDVLNGNDGPLDWQGARSLTTKLPTTLRVGAAWEMNEKLRVGVDVIAPINDEASNFEKAVISVGGDFSPIKWLRLSAGFITGGNYNFKVPAGLTFVTGKGTWEAGVASRDIVTFFTENDPTLSMSMGFLRFRF